MKGTQEYKLGKATFGAFQANDLSLPAPSIQMARLKLIVLKTRPNTNKRSCQPDRDHESQYCLP